MAGNRPSGSAPERVNSSVWQTPVALISTNTSPARGPSSWTVVISSGLPAATATAARTSMAIPRFSAFRCLVRVGWACDPHKGRCDIAHDRALQQQMKNDLDKFAARAAPATFVLLWSTGFIATKYVLHDAEPLTYLAIRMAFVVGLMAIIVGVARPKWPDRAG